MSGDKLIRQIKQRIQQNMSQDQLLQLQLDGLSIVQFTKQIKNIIQSYPSIQYLTINDCQLISLSNFPKLPNLTILQLSNNKICDDELFNILKNSHISHLMIDENRLKSIQKVSILRQLPNLQQLQIANNLFGSTDFYREELFDRIPQLKIIDCKDKFGNIAIDSQSQSDGEEQQNSMIAVMKNPYQNNSSEQNSQINQNKQDKQIKQTNNPKYQTKKQTSQSLLDLIQNQKQLISDQQDNSFDYQSKNNQKVNKLKQEQQILNNKYGAKKIKPNQIYPSKCHQHYVKRLKKHKQQQTSLVQEEGYPSSSYHQTNH